jgi:hypothetical protein
VLCTIEYSVRRCVCGDALLGNQVDVWRLLKRSAKTLMSSLEACIASEPIAA